MFGKILASFAVAAGLTAPAAAARGAPVSAESARGTTRGPEAMIRELAAIERPQVNLGHLSLQELLRDSAVAKRINHLREEIGRAGPGALDGLVRATAACRSPESMRVLVGALIHLEARAAVEPLAAMLADRQVGAACRRQIPQLLGLMGGPAQVAVLEGASAESDVILPREAVFGLGLLHERGSLPALHRIVDRGSDLARSAAAEVLGEIDDFSAVDKLIEKLGDPNPYVRTFAGSSLSELTYRRPPRPPRTAAELQRGWAEWWASRRGRRREELMEEAIREGLAALSGQDPGAAFDSAVWLAEISFQPSPGAEAFRSPLRAVVQFLAAVQWREWSRRYGSLGRREWFRLAVDRGVEQLQSADAALSFEGLAVLNELIRHPMGQPYLWRAVWAIESGAERARVAREYRDWWARKRSSFDPRGRRHW